MATGRDALEVLCVLGMHRSGTSLTAGALERLGVDFGEAERLDPPKPENPAGFFEHLALQHLNDDVLDALGGSWADPPPLDAGWERDERLRPLRDRASAFVTAFRAETRDPAGWKDPRLSLLLPFWRELIDLRGVVVTIRDPAEVAISLARRDGFTTEHSAYLWVRYTASAWLHASDPLVIDHRSYWDDLDTPVDRLRRFAGSELGPEEARASVCQLFEPGLRRSMDREGELRDGGLLYSLARHLYRLIREEETDVVRPVLEGLSRGWTQVTSFSEAVRVSRTAHRLPVRLGLRAVDLIERFRRGG